MFKLLSAVLAMVSLSAHSAENITILSPYSASHSGSAAMFKILEQANRQQSRYNFILEFKPGGEQIIAVRTMDEQPQNRLAIIAPKYADHVNAGRLKSDNYEPVWALGDACWAVITNVGNERQGVASLKGQRELVVGGVGFGNAAHLTALQLGEKYGFQVRYVPFKSNFDALVLMAADGSVNMVLERVANYQQMKQKNPNIRALAMSCGQRDPAMPELRTLAEQGISAPSVFNIVIASHNMLATRQEDIGKVLTAATAQVGAKEIQQASDMRPPQFDNISTVRYYNQTMSRLLELLRKYQTEINKQQ